MPPYYDEEIVHRGQTGGIMDYGVCSSTEGNETHVLNSSPHAGIGTSEYAGAIQFEKFNMWRMCPMVQVSFSLRVYEAVHV